MRLFAWLLSMSLSLARYVWPVTLLLLAAPAVSLFAQARKGAALKSIPWRWVAIGFVFPLAILLVGTLWHAGPKWKPRSGAVWGIYGLLVLHILTAALTTRRAAGARWVAATVGACQVWWSLGAAFVALMSVTGDWL